MNEGRVASRRPLLSAPSAPLSPARQRRTGLECRVIWVVDGHEPDPMLSIPVSAREQAGGSGRGGMQT